MHNIARFLIILGVVFVVIGFLFLVLPKNHLFKLPGDIVMRRGNSLFIFPLVTSIVISVILTVILNLIFRK